MTRPPDVAYGTHMCDLSADHVGPHHCPVCGTSWSHPVCTCAPCVHPGYGAPGLTHCAACCYGTLIEEYDLDCPVPAHQELAIRQHVRLQSDPSERPYSVDPEEHWYALHDGWVGRH